MAKSSLDNSTPVENPSFASRIVFTRLAEGNAVLRVSLDNQLSKCSPSLIHEYLWALGELVEQAQAKLACEWEPKFREDLKLGRVSVNEG